MEIRQAAKPTKKTNLRVLEEKERKKEQKDDATEELKSRGLTTTEQQENQ